MSSRSHVQLSATPWAVACQAPLSIQFSRQEYWSGLPLPSPGDLPDSGTEPESPAWQTDSLPEPPGKPIYVCMHYLYISLNHFAVQQEQMHHCNQLHFNKKCFLKKNQQIPRRFSPPETAVSSPNATFVEILETVPTDNQYTTQQRQTLRKPPLKQTVITSQLL